MARLLFELVGPNYDLSKAEVIGALQGLSYSPETERYEEGILVLRTNCPPHKLFSRLGLTRRIHHHIATAPRKGYDFSKLFKDKDIPKGSAAVRTRRIKGHEADTKEIREKLGAVIAEKNLIDLDDPDHEIYVLVSKNLFITKNIYEFDRKRFSEREVKRRPFSCPISLKPWFTRALINLARPGEKPRLHDPFCGTGGVLIEGYNMGLKVSGGDIDADMIEGCRKNLREFEVEAELEVGDVSETIPEDIDIIVTDPPYGRASSTSEEDLYSIYQRLFRTAQNRLKEEGHLAAVFPGYDYIEMGERYLDLVETHMLKVHRSLDRYFTTFKKFE